MSEKKAIPLCLSHMSEGGLAQKYVKRALPVAAAKSSSIKW